MSYSKSDKVKIIVDITKQLKLFPSANGGTIDIYNDEYTYIDEFKKITNKWINEDDLDLRGFIHFEEINKYFEYHFPRSKNNQPLFVLRKDLKFN